METEVAQPRPAATVVIARPAPEGFEILLQRRASNLAFMGGIWVFPGGRVDESDGRPDRLIETARVCARREALEESGIDLDRAGVDDTACALLPFARWVTPAIEKRRYDTLFFVARVAPGTEATEDGHEATETLWITPASALERSKTGALLLSPPTLVTLHDLVGIETIEQIDAWTRDRDLTPVEPLATLTEAGPTVIFPGDPLLGGPSVPSRPTRCVFVDGRWILTHA